MLFAVTWAMSETHHLAVGQNRLYTMTLWLTVAYIIAFPARRALGYVWLEWWLHSPLVVFVVLISMPIIYESATGYGQRGAQG